MIKCGEFMFFDVDYVKNIRRKLFDYVKSVLGIVCDFFVCYKSNIKYFWLQKYIRKGERII
jgi:hypothetical protein